jgi:DNA-binding FrmR family transcriptional regulator
MEEKKNLINRLKRIEGQVRGLQNMIDEDRGCYEILTQLSAVTKALEKTGEAIVKNYTKNCIIQYEKTKDEQLLDNLITTISKFHKI